MLRALALFACLSSAFAFVPAAGNVSRGSSSSMTKNTILKSSAASEVSANVLVDPSQRDTHYDGNVAQYLCDLHDNKSTFDFCGGMMFQREWRRIAFFVGVSLSSLLLLLFLIHSSCFFFYFFSVLSIKILRHSRPI